MKTKVDRRTVNLSAYPDLVVVYLGMRVNAWYGLKTIAGVGLQIQQSVNEQPKGLLLHEDIVWGWFPPHIGMRQYWQDFDSLEKWTRSGLHRDWWKKFLKDSGGTGFWHETYFMRGGMEAVYDDVFQELGFLKFAPAEPAKGSMFSARSRAKRPSDPTAVPIYSEDELYSD